MCAELTKDQMAEDWESVRGFAFQIINRTRRNPVYWRISEADLVQEAFLGVCEARRRFDPSKGTKFLTYAGWWIRHHVKRFCDANCGGLSGHGYAAKPGSNAQGAMLRSVACRSMQDPLKRRAKFRDEERQAMLADDGMAEIIERKRDLLDLEFVEEILRDCLTPREADIYRAYHGHGMIMREIGEKHGLSKERTRQILVRAQERVAGVAEDRVAREKAIAARKRLEANRAARSGKKKTA